MDRQRHLWRSVPCCQGRQVFHGRYEKEEDAARASDFKNIHLNGKSACLNFPAEWPPERIRTIYEAGQAERERLEREAESKKAKGKRKAKEAMADRPDRSSTPEDATPAEHGKAGRR